MAIDLVPGDLVTWESDKRYDWQTCTMFPGKVHLGIVINVYEQRIWLKRRKTTTSCTYCSVYFSEQVYYPNGGKVVVSNYVKDVCPERLKKVT